MARILRGEIRWADLNPTRGREQVQRMGKLIGRASQEELAQVVEGLNEIIASPVSGMQREAAQ